jgi:hypothetical protein
MSAKHTPGPWMVGGDRPGDSSAMALMIYCDDSLGSRVADCSESGHGIPREQDYANARLIAAAPDLLALARQYASECGECNGTGNSGNEVLGDEDCEACEDIRTVIAKAERA